MRNFIFFIFHFFNSQRQQLIFTEYYAVINKVDNPNLIKHVYSQLQPPAARIVSPPQTRLESIHE